jgi:hypothetical protein
MSKCTSTTAWRVAAKAGPHLCIAALIPSVAFIVGRHFWGLGGAIGLALAWNATCQVTRRIRGQEWSGLLVIGSISLGLRATVALALHSAQVFFLAPALITLVMGAIYIGTAFSSTPLLNRVARDLIPNSVLDTENPRIAMLLQISSVIYGVEQWLAALVSIIMVVNMSTTAYVAVHELASCAVLGLVAAITVPFFIGPVRDATRPLALAA